MRSNATMIVREVFEWCCCFEISVSESFVLFARLVDLTESIENNFTHRLLVDFLLLFNNAEFIHHAKGRILGFISRRN